MDLSLGAVDDICGVDGFSLAIKPRPTPTSRPKEQHYRFLSILLALLSRSSASSAEDHSLLASLLSETQETAYFPSRCCFQAFCIRLICPAVNGWFLQRLYNVSLSSRIHLRAPVGHDLLRSILHDIMDWVLARAVRTSIRLVCRAFPDIPGPSLHRRIVHVVSRSAAAVALERVIQMQPVTDFMRCHAANEQLVHIGRCCVDLDAAVVAVVRRHRRHGEVADAAVLRRTQDIVEVERAVCPPT